MSRSQRTGVSITPFHVAGVLFLAVGLLFGIYRGLMEFGAVPDVSWMTWSHIHFVTIGGFSQLVVGMAPQLLASKLDRPTPSSWFTWTSFLGLNSGFLVLWYGRAFDAIPAFDLGLAVVWLVIFGLFAVSVRMALQTDRDAWDATVGLYLLSSFVFLLGILFAIGLYSHPWTVPGGWHGLRESHVHANSFGFLGFAIFASLYEVFPRIVDAELYSERLKGYSFWFLLVGIVGMVMGPWTAMDELVTGPGLTLYGIGFLLYFYNLYRTYRAGTSSGLAQSILASQAWLLGPALFAPFLLYGIPLGIDGAWVEQGALHFLFMGFALPVALGGVLYFFRNQPGVGLGAAAGESLPDAVVPGGISTWMVALWNVAVLGVGVAFFFQDQSWAPYLHVVGWPILVVIWGYQLALVARQRLAVRETVVST